MPSRPALAGFARTLPHIVPDLVVFAGNCRKSLQHWSISVEICQDCQKASRNHSINPEIPELSGLGSNFDRLMTNLADEQSGSRPYVWSALISAGAAPRSESANPSLRAILQSCPPGSTGPQVRSVPTPLRVRGRGVEPECVAHVGPLPNDNPQGLLKRSGTIPHMRNVQLGLGLLQPVHRRRARAHQANGDWHVAFKEDRMPENAVLCAPRASKGGQTASYTAAAMDATDDPPRPPD